MNHKLYEYESMVYEAKGKGGAYVAFPYDIREEFCKYGRQKRRWERVLPNWAAQRYPGKNRQTARRPGFCNHKGEGIAVSNGYSFVLNVF